MTTLLVFIGLNAFIFFKAVDVIADSFGAGGTLSLTILTADWRSPAAIGAMCLLLIILFRNLTSLLEQISDHKAGGSAGSSYTTPTLAALVFLLLIVLLNSLPRVY